MTNPNSPTTNREKIQLDTNAISSLITILAANYSISEQTINHILSNFYQEKELFENVDFSQIIGDEKFKSLDYFVEDCSQTIIDGLYKKLYKTYKNLNEETFLLQTKESLLSNLDNDINKKIEFMKNLKNKTEVEKSYHNQVLALMLLAREILNKKTKKKFFYLQIVTQTSREITQTIQATQ